MTRILLALAALIAFVAYLQTEEDAWHRCTTNYSNATCVAILQR